MGARRRVARHANRPLHTEIAYGGDEDARLNAVLGAGVVDAAGDAVEVILVAQADERGVVGGHEQLDVDRPLGGAAGEVLVGHVAVVLARPDHIGGEVVGAQEVEEVRVGEALGGGEESFRDGQPVALGEPADQVRSGRPLEMDVELGLGNAHRSTSTTGGGAAAGSPSVNAARSDSAARAAASGSAACTSASGRPPGSTVSPGAATSVSPTA